MRVRQAVRVAVKLLRRAEALSRLRANSQVTSAAESDKIYAAAVFRRIFVRIAVREAVV